MDKLYTKQDVANLFQVSVKTIDRMRNYKTNKLKSIKIKGTVRFLLQDIEEYLKKHKS